MSYNHFHITALFSSLIYLIQGQRMHAVHSAESLPLASSYHNINIDDVVEEMMIWWYCRLNPLVSSMSEGIPFKGVWPPPWRSRRKNHRKSPRDFCLAWGTYIIIIIIEWNTLVLFDEQRLCDDNNNAVCFPASCYCFCCCTVVPSKKEDV